MDNLTLRNFLDRISALESSRGTNLKHQTINSGIQSGQRAIGKYGMLNNTIQETLNRQANKGELPDELDALRGADQETVRQKFAQHPEYEENVASYLANRVLNNQGGDEVKAAYAWNNGHNLSPEQITPEKLENSNYAQKYDDLKSADEDQQAEQMKQRANQRALQLLGQQDNSATLADPQNLQNVDKAIQNMQGIRNKVKVNS